MEWRREGQHSAGNIDHEYADGRNMQEGQRSTNPGLQLESKFRSGQDKEVYLVQMHQIENRLEQENKRLKEMVADLALANELLKKGRTRH